MVRVRRQKVAAVAQDIPNVLPAGDLEGDCSSCVELDVRFDYRGAESAARKGRKIGHLHPALPQSASSNLADIFKRYKRILVPELNMGQLCGFCAQSIS